MALRIAFTPRDAGNNRGILAAALCDWHRGVADIHLGTGHTVPTQDAGYTTASELQCAIIKSISSFLTEESIYAC